jgi:fatty acid desaturase
MDEVFARRDLITPDVLRRLTQKSDLSGWLQVASHFGAIAVTGAALWWGIGPGAGTPFGLPVAIVAFLLHGTLINFLYAGQHELSHWTVFRTRGLNEFFGRLIGFIVLYPRDFDQIQHHAHHRYTQEWARDGELARPPYTLWSYVLWLTGPTYWYSRIRRILRFSAGIVSEPYIPDSRKPEVIREARWHLAGYAAIAVASVALQSWAAVVFWLAPMFLTKIVHQLQNTIEHLGLSHEPNVLENTRSTRTNALMRWVCWNMQYHTAHHAFPGVPFYRLKELHGVIFTEKGREPHTMTYLSFQAKVLRALASARSEAEFPDNAAWITEQGDAGGRKAA